MTTDDLIYLALAIPVAGALLLWSVGRIQPVREGVSLLISAGLFATVAALVPAVMSGARPAVSLFEFAPGLPFAFEVEPLGMLFALLASFLWVITTIYTIGYLRANGGPHQTRFLICFSLALASVIGVAFAGNMLTLFFFYEALTLCTYPLVTHSGTETARQGGRRYLAILLSTSILLQLLAILWTWVATGTLEFRSGGILSGKVSEPVMAILLLLYVFGVGKAALMPFHGWLPAAMVAPTPVSALLHAVAVVKAGVFTIAKLGLYIFGLDNLREFAISEWLLYVAGATILIASLIALRQDNLKRLLAYSTVSQLSYVVIGVAIANAHAVMGATLHIAMHGFAKITLFFCAGAIITATRKTEISQLDGIGRTMPVTMGAFAIGSFSLIGLPPFSGAWSKYYLVLGSLDEGYYAVLAVLLASSLLNALYFLPIVMRAFFPTGGAQPAAVSGIAEAPVMQLVAISITALGSMVLFAYPQLLFNLLRPLVGM
ncbi:MAG: cation:proton antiporter [Rhodospirillaceae bacterium]|nr:cation:proton antiporter [Rhodospirillaceae bacterium]|tara:strand:+ start:822 stop:2288 length:1467 start_codon:yes stop_codon:yes gene_type:complete